jgi:hypothetical protein
MTHNPLISMVPPARIELAAHGLGILIKQIPLTSHSVLLSEKIDKINIDLSLHFP